MEDKHSTSNLEYSDCKDRISELPDSVLHYILSLLPSTTDVMKTSLLSKRWENLWQFVPSLHFINKDFDDGNKFKGFVDGFLMSRAATTVHTFDLNLTGKNRSEKYYAWYQFIIWWIGYAIRRKVKVLHVNITEFDGRIDPSELLITCQSLEELSLKIKPSPSKALKLIPLCQLKKLVLQYVKYNDVLEITSVCPLLQDLFLEHCKFKKLDISSQTLTTLRMGFCGGTLLRISCPNLTSFEYIGPVGPFRDFEKIVLDGLSSLKRGSIQRSFILGGNSFKGLSNANSLLLADINFENLSKHLFSEFPTFYNLKRLHLGGFNLRMGESLRQNLGRFLGFTPNLEMLSLGIQYSDQVETSWELMDPSFVCLRLYDVKIKYNERVGAEIHKLVRFLLANVKSIKNMILKEFKGQRPYPKDIGI